MRISYSLLQTYRNCPLRYKLQYLDKVPHIQSMSAIVGVLLHRVFEMATKSELSSKEASLSFFSSNLDKIIQERDNIAPQEIISFHNTGNRAIEYYWEQLLPLQTNVYAIEMPISIRFVGNDGAEHEIRGFADRVDTNNNEYTIVDYKSGSDNPSKSELQNSLQFGIYAWGLLEHSPLLPPDKIFVQLINVRLQKMVETEVTKATIESVKGVVGEIVDNIDKSATTKQYEPREGDYCRHCPFTKRCPLFNSD